MRLLGTGWDFDCYEVDGRWVFRFPRRAAEQRRLERDLAILPWIDEHIDAPMPRYAWGLLRASVFPYAFSGYEKLEGRLMAEVAPHAMDVQALGRRLGAFFGRLHALTPSRELVVGLGLDRKPHVEPGPYRDRLRRYTEGFADFAPALAARADQFFEGADHLPASSDRQCLTHDDLHPEHILLDPQRLDRVTGLLDWSDVGLADPAREFGCLYPWGGEPILRAALEAYGNEDPAFRARCRFYGVCLAFVDIHHARRTGQDERAGWTLPILDEALPR